jgi:hypothetical protein
MMCIMCFPSNTIFFDDSAHSRLGCVGAANAWIWIFEFRAPEENSENTRLDCIMYVNE